MHPQIAFHELLTSLTLSRRENGPERWLATPIINQYSMRNTLNRRAFLAASSATALASAANSVFASVASPAPRVIIAGGGLAGLSCAYELLKHGFDIVVLEGQGRAGGRVQTLREGLYPGLTAEAGATRIPHTHDLTLSYANEFRLTLEPFHSGGLADLIHLRGRNYIAGQHPEPHWPLNLTPQERRLGRKGLADQYLGAPLRRAKGTVKSTDVPKAILQEDGLSLNDYLKKQGLSQDAIELMTLGFDPAFSAALVLLVNFNEQVSRQYFHISGGNDRLPDAIARRLGRVVRYGCRVMSIGQDDRGAWVVVEHGGGHEIVRGDYVVSALPFSVARNLFSEAHLPFGQASCHPGTALLPRKQGIPSNAESVLEVTRSQWICKY